MSTIIVFKALAAPVLIAAVTVLIRRFGPAVGGLVMGIPLVTGPISAFTAFEHGAAFARQAAVANLAGQISTCLFCFSFALAARRMGPLLSALVGVGVFFAATAVWNLVPWSLLVASVVLLGSLALLTRLMPTSAHIPTDRIAPWWDLPVRMILAATFVVLLTSVTGALGPRLSGLLAPFPVIVLILSIFVHAQHGGGATVAMMRGVILGSLSFASFFVALAASLGSLPVVGAYTVALAASLVAAGVVYVVLHQPVRRWPWAPASR